MKIKIFCHSLLSDWNHGNAHFLRGVATELVTRGHDVDVYEPRNSWSLSNLLYDRGPDAVKGFRRTYPLLDSIRYDSDLDLDEALAGADLVLVHEWNDHALVREIGKHRARRGSYRLLFHDTHHRSATDPDSMAEYDLSNYDGVLAFGDVIRQIYVDRGWAKRAWTWHEAADPRVFRPLWSELQGDVVWVGNWGDEERTQELHEFLLNPVKELGLKATVFGVRYPDHALKALEEAGIQYGGSLANYEAPEVFSRFRMTVHVPRRPYVLALPGIPTIRVFEALACGVPLISAPWTDAEGLFTPGQDFATAANGEEMKHQMKRILDEPDYARELGDHGRRTVLARHTCAHRVDELMSIVHEMKCEAVSVR